MHGDWRCLEIILCAAINEVDELFDYQFDFSRRVVCATRVSGQMPISMNEEWDINTVSPLRLPARLKSLLRVRQVALRVLCREAHVHFYMFKRYLPLIVLFFCIFFQTVARETVKISGFYANAVRLFCSQVWEYRRNRY